MLLDKQTLRLIAVGASVSANCQPCLEHNIEMALNSGASREQIGEAIDVGRMVRQGAATKLDRFVAGFNEAVDEADPKANGGCECVSLNPPNGGKNG